MSGIFKKFRKDDIQITPFEAHKDYLIYVSNYTGSYYERGYEQSEIADYTITASAAGTNVRPISLSTFTYISQFDDSQFVPDTIGSYLGTHSASIHSKTTNGFFERSIHDSIQGMYYTNPDDPAWTLDNNGYEKEIRTLFKKAQVLSVPQRMFGERIKKGTVKLQSGSLTIIDDGYGNLIDASVYIAAASQSVNYKSQSVFSMDFVDLYNKAKGQTINAHSINALASSSYYRDNGKEYYDLSNKTRFFERSPYPNRVKAHKIKPITSSPTIENTFVLFDGETPTTTDSRINVESQSLMIIDDAKQFDFRKNEDFAVYFRFRQNPNHLNKTAVQNANPEEYQSLINKIDPIYTGRYPFDIGIYHDAASGGNANKITARISDGVTTTELKSTGSISTAIFQNIIFTKSGSTVSLFWNGELQQSATIPEGDIYNKGNIVVAAKPYDAKKYRVKQDTRYSRTRRPMIEYKGHNKMRVSNIMIFDKNLSQSEISFVANRPEFDNRVGNVFYNHGLVVLTSQRTQYYNSLDGTKPLLSDVTLSFQNTHTIIEHEYNCHIKEREYGFTMNPTIISESKFNTIENFVTGSEFSPYVTTIGLYDDNARLLAVGKLSRPIKKSNDYDTTFVVAFDT